MRRLETAHEPAGTAESRYARAAIVALLAFKAIIIAAFVFLILQIALGTH